MVDGILDGWNSTSDTLRVCDMFIGVERNIEINLGGIASTRGRKLGGM